MAQDSDDHLLPLLTVARHAADEVKRARSIELANRVAAVVVEMEGARRIAPVIIFLSHHHHRIIGVTEN